MKNSSEIKNVFLDSSIFEEQNFLHGTKMHSIQFYAKTNAINLYMTPLSRLELFNRAKKRIIECKSEIKKVEKSYNAKNINVIKNLDLFDKVKIPQIDTEKHYLELKKKLTNYLKLAKVTIIPHRNIPITEIFEDFYNQRPPFHNSGKRNEFADAFILNTLEVWCRKNKTKMIVLSKDPDFKGFKSEYLVHKADLANYLSEISNFSDEKGKYNKKIEINKLVKVCKISIEEQALEILRDKLTIYSNDIEISDVEFIKTQLISHNIITKREYTTEIEFEIKLIIGLIEHNYEDFRNSRRRVQAVISTFLQGETKKGYIELKTRVENSEYIYRQNA